MDNERDITMDVKMNNKCFPDIEKLAAGEAADESQILAVLDFIDARYDCADFRLVCILRSLFDFARLISPPTLARMKQTVLGFKYWMDEPGEDSMCYWSENHQLLFAVCEYLAGQLYPDEIFMNDGKTGQAHRDKAKKRLDFWLETRFCFGFVEWHSNTYYEEDIAPLSLLVDCCEDTQLSAKAEMLLDLLLLDMAAHSYKGLFCATSGRCYEAQKKDPFKQDVLDIAGKAFGQGNISRYDYTRLSADFILNRKYRVPEVIVEIARSREPMTIRDSMGLSLGEVAQHFPNRNDMNGRGMYLWSMEAFTNTESIDLTLRIFNAWKLRHNDFLKNISMVNIPVVRSIGILPLVVRLLNPVTQGIAIQRANSYTHRTQDYMLSTAQQYHPGEFGDQQHIWQATLDGGIAVFSTHPGAAFFDDNARNFSPSYWVGNGINPHAVQHENVCLCLYDLNRRKGLLEKERLWFSHAWFPAARFDETVLEGRLAAGRKGGGFVALLTTQDMERADENELIQRGHVTGWAVVMGRAAEETFEAFVARMRSCTLRLHEKTMCVQVGGRDYMLEYGKGLRVDGAHIEVDHPRLDAPFAQAPREPEAYEVAYAEKRLRLDWRSQHREFS